MHLKKKIVIKHSDIYKNNLETVKESIQRIKHEYNNVLWQFYEEFDKYTLKLFKKSNPGSNLYRVCDATL